MAVERSLSIIEPDTAKLEIDVFFKSDELCPRTR